MGIYFDSNTTVPLQCVALVVWKTYFWQGYTSSLFLSVIPYTIP